MRVVVAPVLVLSTSHPLRIRVSRCSRFPTAASCSGFHKASFIVWVGAMSIHVLAYTLRAP